MAPVHLLLQTNIELLESSRELLERLEDDVYTEPAPDGSGHRIGAQFRHVIEFYVCLVEGARSGSVDYDSRKRVLLLERSRPAAITRIERLIATLANANHWAEAPLNVRMEDAPHESSAAWMLSSISRELQAVRSHTIHHFALIAMTLRAWGIQVDSTFGVAPSTLRYRAQQAQAAA